MNCYYLCMYNKSINRFSTMMVDEVVEDDESVWHMLMIYLRKDSESSVSYGYDACCLYVEDIQNNIPIDKDSLSCFLNFKSYLCKQVHDLCYDGKIVTSPHICDEYVDLWKKCERSFSKCVPKDNEFIDLLNKLQIEEKELIPKMLGLRVIDSIR